jgi:uncharacterized protein YeaO (DUF488 family)
MIIVKRVYNLQANEFTGFKVLVDRLWPRGIGKDRVDLWLKDIAPSAELRNWFKHDPEKWNEFKLRYWEELDKKNELVDRILQKERTETVYLLYGAKDERFNNAVALKEYIDNKK